jgi:hypothetical protein
LHVERSVDVKREDSRIYEYSVGDLISAVRKERKESVDGPMLPLSWLDTAGEGSNGESTSSNDSSGLQLQSEKYQGQCHK